jgi:hypothetical protein
VIAAAPGEKTGQEISRQHERPPSFVLSYVDVFVVAGTIEARAIPSEDHMTETHRGRTDQEAPTEEKSGETTVDLDCASFDPHLTPAQERKRDEAKPQRCIRQSPEIFQYLHEVTSQFALFGLEFVSSDFILMLKNSFCPECTPCDRNTLFIS